MHKNDSNNNETPPNYSINFTNLPTQIIEQPDHEIVDELFRAADEALQRGPYSVTDKLSSPPSKNKHDYFHPAPYFWPNPDTPTGLPYVNLDGRRVPGTILYGPDSEKFDRTRLQRLFDDSLVLALAWRYGGRSQYLEHAAKLLNHFFLDPETRVTSHLKYAQVRRGHNGDMGSAAGLIEMKDMYFYVDAVRLLREAGSLSCEQIEIFKKWMLDYLSWLTTSPQGKTESRAKNNHGIYYDLQVASIASYLERDDVVVTAIERAEDRMSHHFAPDGSQPLELQRNTSAHYCAFNLQGWINFGELAHRYGVDLWQAGKGLREAARWLCTCDFAPWPYEQIDAFNVARLAPIEMAAISHGCLQNKIPERYATAPAVFHPHDGIRPFWQL